MVHLPYRGEAPMIQDLLGGQIQLAYCGLRIARPHIETGRLHAVGITGEQRIASAPELPTLIEQGLQQPHHRLTVWLGLAAPAGTPRETVELLSSQARRACQQPAVRQCIADLGCEVRAAGPQAFAAIYDQQAPLWERLVRESGVRLE
jgi:tripartite-type tricarboxylate transporter receptor subunit TctC